MDSNWGDTSVSLKHLNDTTFQVSYNCSPDQIYDVVSVVLEKPTNDTSIMEEVTRFEYKVICQPQVRWAWDWGNMILVLTAFWVLVTATWTGPVPYVMAMEKKVFFGLHNGLKRKMTGIFCMSFLGHIVMYYWHDSLDILCNFPVVILTITAATQLVYADPQQAGLCAWISTILLVLATIIIYAVMMTQDFTGQWFLSDVMAIVIIGFFLKSDFVKIRSLEQGKWYLIALITYDVIMVWVPFQHFITRASGTTGQWSLPYDFGLKVDAPYTLKIPHLSEDYPNLTPCWLSIFDVIWPGVFIKFLVTYEKCNVRGVSLYSSSALASFVIGLTLCYLFTSIFETEQPFQLYISGSILISTYIVAHSRNELSQLKQGIKIDEEWKQVQGVKPLPKGKKRVKVNYAKAGRVDEEIEL